MQTGRRRAASGGGGRAAAAAVPNKDRQKERYKKLGRQVKMSRSMKWQGESPRK